MVPKPMTPYGFCRLNPEISRIEKVDCETSKIQFVPILNRESLVEGRLERAVDPIP